MIFIDVTVISTVPRNTGIQRILRDVVSNCPQIQLLKFDEGSRKFKRVQRLPVLENRFSNRETAYLFRAVKSFAYMAWPIARAGFSLVQSASGSSWLLERARGLYSRYFSAQVLKNTEQGLGGESVEVSLNPDDWLWLLDIPKSSSHLLHLRRVAKEAQLGMYVYDLIPIDYPELMSTDAEKLRSDYSRYLELAIDAKRVFCLSDYTNERLQAYLKAKNVSRPLDTLYPPLDLARYGNTTLSDLATRVVQRSEFRQPKPTIKILSIAPLNKRKNMGVLFEAVRQALEAGAGIELVHVEPAVSSVETGHQMLSRSLRKNFPKNFSVVSEISDEELVALYGEADVVAVPSLVEGFGLPVVEGLLFGCEILASRIPVFEELSKVAPITLISPSSVSEWLAAILRCSKKSGQNPRVNPSHLVTDPRDFCEVLSRGT